MRHIAKAVIHSLFTGIAAALVFGAVNLGGTTPAYAETASVTQAYTVTDSESTAVDLNMTYRADLSAERAHLMTSEFDEDPEHYCAAVSQRALGFEGDMFVYTWIECYQH